MAAAHQIACPPKRFDIAMPQLPNKAKMAMQTVICERAKRSK